MERETILEIVNTLIKHTNLVKDWRRFKDALRLKNCFDFESIGNQYKIGTVTAYELFFKIISEWNAEHGTDSSIELLCDVLIKIGCKSTADDLKAASLPISSTRFQTTFQFPKPTSNFVGRTKVLKEINNFYCNTKTNLVKVVGMGGVGKSELAKYFAYLKIEGTTQLWLNGESAESLQNSILKFAKSLRIQTTKGAKPRRCDKIFKDVVFAIKSKNKKRLLLIIDNVDMENDDVELVAIVANELDCFILVTSRHITALRASGKIAHLNVFEDFEAQDLINSTFKEESSEDVNELCELLQNFPLALQQTLAFIQDKKLTDFLGQSYRIRNYLNNYEEEKKKMLDHGLSKIDHKYDKTTFVTGNVSIERIKMKGETGLLAIQLLNLIAYFEADAIPVGLITKLHEDRPDVAEALKLLQIVSLITIANYQISIHRLIQEVTRVRYSEAELEFELLQSYIQIINDTRGRLEELDMPHILCLWKYASKHPAIVKDSSTFPYNIAIKLESLNLFRDMERFARECCRILNIVLGDKHKETLRMNERVARSVMRNGKYSESFEMYKKVVSSQRSILGEENETTLLSRGNQGWVLYQLKRYEEALEMYESLLELRLKTKYINYEEVMVLKENIASSRMQKREFQVPMQMYDEVLGWRRKNYGEKDERTLNTRYNIARCLFNQNEYTRAKVILKQLLTSNQPPLDLLFTKELLACVFSALGEKARAVELGTQVLVARQKLHGHKHPHTIGAKQNLVIFSSKKANTIQVMQS